MDYFEIQILLHLRSLDLSADDHTITEDEIKSKYKKLAILYHPDRQSLVGDGKMKEINEAKEFLLKNLNEVNRFILAGSPKARFEAEERERRAREEEKRKKEDERKKREAEEAAKREEERRERERLEKERRAKEAEEHRKREAAEEKARKRREAEEARIREEQKRLEEERYIASLPNRAAEKYKALQTEAERLKFRNDRIMRKKALKRLSAVAAAAAVLITVTVIAATSISNNIAKKRAAYESGIQLFESESYAEAEEYFKKAGSYEDARSYLALSGAYKLVKTDPCAAALTFGAIKTPDAMAMSRELFWNNSYANSSVAMGDDYHAVLTLSGRVNYVYTGNDEYGSLENELSEWENISYITGNNYTVAGVTTGGKVLISGHYNLSRKTKDWKNIIAVYISGDDLVGLCADGSVKTTSKKGTFGKMRKWKGICDIDITSFEYVDVHDTHYDEIAIGVDKDGRVHLAGPTEDSFSTDIIEKSSKWENIKAVSISDSRYIGTHIVGLTENGTVVAAGTNRDGMIEVGDWKNIVDIHTTSTYTFGITEEGTVVLAGKDAFSQKSVKDIKEAACFVDVENLLVLDRYAYFQCEDGRKTFFEKWNGLAHVPKFE